MHHTGTRAGVPPLGLAPSRRKCLNLPPSPRCPASRPAPSASRIHPPILATRTDAPTAGVNLLPRVRCPASRPAPSARLRCSQNTQHSQAKQSPRAAGPQRGACSASLRSRLTGGFRLPRADCKTHPGLRSATTPRPPGLPQHSCSSVVERPLQNRKTGSPVLIAGAGTPPPAR